LVEIAGVGQGISKNLNKQQQMTTPPINIMASIIGGHHKTKSEGATPLMGNQLAKNYLANTNVTSNQGKN
jgi:hypothetical protein